VAPPATDLQALVADLRRTKTLLAPEELVHRLPRTVTSGLPALDELLGGGLPEGKTIAVAGPAGGAATALSLSVLAAFTGAGSLAAVVDRGDGFDPASAADAGVDLSRLLWCRPASAKEAVKAADVLLASGAFPVVVLDLRTEEGAGGPDTGRRRRREAEPPGAAWLRLSRVAETSRARLLVLGGAEGAGSFAAASLSCGRPAARFAGAGPGRTFEGIEVEVALAHNRLGLVPGAVRLSFRAPDHFPGAAAGSASGDPSCRGPRGAREEGGDPWELPAAAPGPEAGGGPRLHAVDEAGGPRPVRDGDTAGGRPRMPGAAGGRGHVHAVDTPGEPRLVRDADTPGGRRRVAGVDTAGERRRNRGSQGTDGLRAEPDEAVLGELRRRWSVVEGGR
jgi:recombination protein RecA